jgi:hypothetical protein
VNEQNLKALPGEKMTFKAEKKDGDKIIDENVKMKATVRAAFARLEKNASYGVGNKIYPESSVAWGTLNAEADDIVEFNGTSWAVSFNAATYHGKITYATNLFTGKLLIWDGLQWSEYILPAYRPAYWRLAL